VSSAVIIVAQRLSSSLSTGSWRAAVSLLSRLSASHLCDTPAGSCAFYEQSRSDPTGVNKVINESILARRLIRVLNSESFEAREV